MTAKKHLLLVEDEKEIMNALRLKIEKKGFAVTPALDGQQAIDLLDTDLFDYILLDLILPIKDGFSVLEEKKNSKNAATPVCVLTAISSEDKLQRARDLGASKCFIKSNTSISDILAHIEAELGNA